MFATPTRPEASHVGFYIEEFWAGIHLPHEPCLFPALRGKTVAFGQDESLYAHDFGSLSSEHADVVEAMYATHRQGAERISVQHTIAGGSVQQPRRLIETSLSPLRQEHLLRTPPVMRRSCSLESDDGIGRGGSIELGDEGGFTTPIRRPFRSDSLFSHFGTIPSSPPPHQPYACEMSPIGSPSQDMLAVLTSEVTSLSNSELPPDPFLLGTQVLEGLFGPCPREHGGPVLTEAELQLHNAELWRIDALSSAHESAPQTEGAWLHGFLSRARGTLVHDLAAKVVGDDLGPLVAIFVGPLVAATPLSSTASVVSPCSLLEECNPLASPLPIWEVTGLEVMGTISTRE